MQTYKELITWRTDGYKDKEQSPANNFKSKHNKSKKYIMFGLNIYEINNNILIIIIFFYLFILFFKY
jgi:hypothetical protein